MDDAYTALIDRQRDAREAVWVAPSRAQVRAMLEGGAGAILADERERFRAVLAEHYLAGITCDHARKEDNPVCGCSLVFLGWHPSLGAAVGAWADHVVEVLGGEEGGDD